MSCTQGGDALLDGQVTVKGILLDKGSNPMRAKVRLKNNFWFEVILELNLSFFDENGVKLGNACGWKPVTLERGLDEWVEFVAPNGQAENFRLAMKKAGS